ncbi:MAG: PDZ domain-containing protein, partial [Thiobacillaceae bacterium]|nr:PDZ domain-containing protein [Thiobacillaceae bacterium]
IQEVSADLAESFGLDKPKGALVAEVETGSPAAKAGVEVSDIILRFDGREVESSIDLPRMVGATKPGTRSTLTLWRKGAIKEVAVVVGEMPSEQTAAAPEKKTNRAGLVVSELSKEQKRQLNIESGVLVEDVTGAAARAGVRPGDVILAVNNREVASAEELSAQISDSKRKSVALLVKRGEGSIYIPLRLD